MKKMLTWLWGLLLVAGLCVNAAAAEERHPHQGDHCVCGGAAVGVGDHTQCEAVRWKPLSEALKAVGRTMSTADFGKLPSGNYYLDGDVVVTADSTIGSKKDKYVTEPATVKELKICLNGYDITRSGEGKVFGYMHMQSSLSICDCSYDGTGFSGTVTGGSTKYGSIIYTYSKSTLNIYGGNFVGHSTVNGGALAIACDGCGDLDGDGDYTETDRGIAEASWLNLYNGHITGSSVSASGGTVQLFHGACMNMYGGTLVGGTAATNGGTIHMNKGTLRISGGQIIGGTATGSGGTLYGSGPIYITGGIMTGGVDKNGTEVVQVIQNDGKLLGTYPTFAEGLAKTQNATNCYLRLINDLETADTVSGTLYLDLNGHTLKGITISGTLYGMDGTTNGYDDSRAGSLIPASGAPVKYFKTTNAQVGAVRKYLTLGDSEGYSFHRYDLAITKVSLKPATVGLGYKATYSGGERVAAALKNTMGFGYRMWISEDAVASRGFGGNRFQKNQELTLRIDRFLDPAASPAENVQRAQTDIHAVAFLQLSDGTLIESPEVCYDLQQVVELADNSYAGYSAAQKNALAQLSAAYSEVMLGWNIENTHHAEGTIWEAVDAAGFKSKLTLRSGTTNYYNLKAGSYLLTEDVDLGDARLYITSGKTVSICLNGFTVTTSNRMFEQYGTLNICDCHESDREGGMISSLAGDSTYSPIAYCRYSSVTNIYGGHLQATGKVRSAGVFAVSHDGSGSNATKPAAVLNVYGGSISGGQVNEHGGLVSVWNGATLNIYGGELFGGTAGVRGGAIDLNTATGFLNIYGGAIHDCASMASAGAINASGSASISGGAFYNNQSGTYGGAICSDSGKLQVTGGTFYGNTAATGGGAIRLYGRTLEAYLAGADIYSNTTDGSGSGVLLNKGHVELGGDLSIEDNDLYVDYFSTVNGDDLTDSAYININPEAMTVLASKGGKERNFYCEGADYTAYDAYGKTVMFQADLSPATDTVGFQVGFGESNITPETIDGMPLQGYSNASNRLAVDEGRKSYDDIMAQSVAITDENGQTVILIFCDLITCNAELFDYVVDAVAAATGVPEQNIFLNFSHSHSVPSVTTTSFPIVVEYNKTLPDLFARSALQAMNDRAPATMETGSFEVQQTVNGKTQYYNFYRHYSYEEDGIVKYFGDQFGEAVYNSTTKPVRDADHTMHLVRFIRDGKDILMSNWRVHPHFTGGESKYLLSADAIGTIRYYMAQKLPDTHYIYFQGAAGNMNETSRMTTSRYKAGLITADQVQNHGLGYVAYGEAVAQIIVDNLGCLESAEPGLLQVDHYDYLAKIDTPTDEEYANAKALYDIYVVETAGMTLSEKNVWVRQYCADHPEYNYTSSFQLGFIVNRRYKEKDTVIPLNVVALGDSFALFTGPFEMWDSISMEVEEKSPFKTTFCLGYSMAHYHYMVYYPGYTDQEDGVPYVSYESENRHFTAPDTVLDMIDYWTTKLNEFYLN